RSSASGCPDADAGGASRAAEPAVAICARSDFTASANPTRVACSAAIRRRWRNATTTATAARINANPSIRPGPAPLDVHPAVGDPPIPRGHRRAPADTLSQYTLTAHRGGLAPVPGRLHALRRELCGLPAAPGLFLRRDWRSLPEAGLEELDTFRRRHLKD